MHTNLLNNPDSFAQQENDEVEQLLATTELLEDSDDEGEIFPDENVTVSTSCPIFMPDEDLNKLVRSLNIKQRITFDVINKWARDFVKNLNCIEPIRVEPFYIFLTGKAGCGKSHLIKTIYHSVTKTLSYRGNEPDKPRVMLLAPTGIAAINIGGNTIHSALHIPINIYGKTVPKLSDKVRSSLRNKLSELRLLIIDEVSMVGNKLLTYIDQRLVEILGCSPELAFGGISIIFSGDFHQLPPIKAAQIFAPYH